MICSQCSMEIPDSARICPYCRSHAEELFRTSTGGGIGDPSGAEHFRTLMAYGIWNGIIIGGFVSYLAFLSEIFLDYEDVFGIPGVLFSGLMVIIVNIASSLIFGSIISARGEKKAGTLGVAFFVFQMVVAAASFPFGIYVLFKL